MFSHRLTRGTSTSQDGTISDGIAIIVGTEKYLLSHRIVGPFGRRSCWIFPGTYSPK
ncbi:MAG: hypothetical protein IPP98_09695 [Gemmatimonadetes bacterium]|nr:hypothetical protein [Gemmatimonadota bacterium]